MIERPVEIIDMNITSVEGTVSASKKLCQLNTICHDRDDVQYQTHILNQMLPKTFVTIDTKVTEKKNMTSKICSTTFDTVTQMS